MAIQPNKKQKVEAMPKANVILQFQNADGETTGPQLDVPDDVTPENLAVLLNGLLGNEEPLPYSFYVQDLEVAGPLRAHLLTNEVSMESALRVVYQPQAVFRVRPVARCTASMPGHADSVLSVNFSPDGRHLASGSGDTTLRFWDLTTQTPLFTSKGHKTHVIAVSWSPDAQIVASGDRSGLIFLWNPHTGEALGSCRGHTKFVTSLAWQPVHLQLPSRRFVSGAGDCCIKVWDTATRRCALSMSSHTKTVTCVRWGGDGLIYSASKDTTINVWDGQEGKLVRSLKGHGHWVNTLALSSEYALRTGAFNHTGRAPPDPQDAQKVAQQRYNEATGGKPERLASGSDDFTVSLWLPATSKVAIKRNSGHVQLINQVSFSPDGRYFVSASFDKAVKLWDGVTGAFVATFRGHVGPVYQVAWSSDSRLAVSGSKDSTLKVWDTRTRKLKLDLPGHADEVYSVDWSPDGASVASGGKDKVLKLWRH